MSETMCKCGVSRERHWKSVGLPLRLFCSGVQGEMREFEPAEPVIEVAPGEPTCEYCGPVCYRGAEHNARVEDGARYTDDPVPAVPAQEAPREHNARPFELSGKAIAAFSSVIKALASAEPQAGAQVHHLFALIPNSTSTLCAICGKESWEYEYHWSSPPQADAKVPSQWIVANSLPGTVRNLAHLCVVLAAALRLADEHISELADAWERGALSEHDGLGGTRSNRNSDVRKAIRVALSEGPEETQVPSQDELLDEGGLSVNDLGLMLAKERTEFVALQTQLNSIKSYATEAAKTPITRESVAATKGEESLRLLAYSQCDELQGLIRLVLSEIGSGL